jgi:hypothetical protein
LQRHGGVPNSRGSHAPCQSAVNGASTRRAFVLLPSLRARGIAVAAVAEGGDNERIDANGAERGLHRVAVGGVADQALADERIGQRRNRGIALDTAGDLLEVVEWEPVAADAGDPGRRAGATTACVLESMRNA